MLRNGTAEAPFQYAATDAFRRAQAFSTAVPPAPDLSSQQRHLLVAVGGPPAADPGPAFAALGADAGGPGGVTTVVLPAALPERAAGLAEALRAADPAPSHLLLLDAAVPDSAAVAAVRVLLARLDAAPRAAAVAAVLDTEDGRELGIDVVLRGEGAGLPRRVLGDAAARLPASWPVVAASTACMVVRADVFRQVGGLDAAYRRDRLCQDADLCLRLRRRGFGVLVVDTGSGLAIPERTSPIPERTTPIPERTTPIPERTTPIPERTTPIPELVEGSLSADAALFSRRWTAFVEASFG